MIRKTWIQRVHICTLSVLIHTTSGTKINNKPLFLIYGALSIRFFSAGKTQAVIIRLMKGAFEDGTKSRLVSNYVVSNDKHSRKMSVSMYNIDIVYITYPLNTFCLRMKCDKKDS